MESQIHLLLIDDDEEDYLISKDLLDDCRGLSYSLNWVDSVENAKKILKEKTFDICLVDFKIGKDNGLDFIQWANNQNIAVPFILLTGQIDPELDLKALKAGASDYLAKGHITPEQLERAIRYAISHFITITQLVQSQRELKILNQELEARVNERTAELLESQKLYRAIAANFPDGMIYVLDQKLNTIFADGKEFANLKIDNQVVLGLPIFAGLSDTILLQCREDLLHVFDGVPVSLEVQIAKKIYQINAVPLFSDGNQIHKILLVAYNITSLKKAEQDILSALEKEKQLNELKSRFVSMASHEFRTPLSTILSSVTLIARYVAPEDEPKRNKHIERIKASVYTLTEILDYFLSLSKLEEGKVVHSPTFFDLVDFSEEIISLMQQIARPGQHISFFYSGERGVCQDKKLLKSILSNLLQNAIKYSSENQTIELHIEVRQDGVRIKVKDRGLGIPKEEQAHVFTRFFRAPNVTHIQGTGLGLNIISKYIDLMRGTIHFDSEEGKGTTFYVFLPINNQPGTDDKL